MNRHPSSNKFYPILIQNVSSSDIIGGNFNIHFDAALDNNGGKIETKSTVTVNTFKTLGLRITLSIYGEYVTRIRDSLLGVKEIQLFNNVLISGSLVSDDL